tara:strand:+ start:657 stop:1058 length:402 start_codon:yes stop_codon:yes gene_type:complete
LEAEHPRIAWIAGRRSSGGPVGARLKKRVTTAKLTTAGYAKHIVGIGDIPYYLESFIINDSRSDGDSDVHVRSIPSGTVRAPASATMFGSNKWLKTKVHQGIEGLMANYEDGAPISPIPTIWPTPGDIASTEE